MSSTAPEIRTWSTRGLRTRYKPKSRLGHGMVSMAPWLDFVLLLFVFGLMNARLILQPGVVVSLPTAPFSQGTGGGLVAVVLPVSHAESGQSGAIVFFDDERFMLSSAEQTQGLAQALVKRLAEHPETSLVLLADKRIAHGTIVELIDMAARVGVQQVNVAVRPE